MLTGKRNKHSLVSDICHKQKMNGSESLTRKCRFGTRGGYHELARVLKECSAQGEKDGEAEKVP